MEKYVAEYCLKQGCFHIGLEKKMYESQVELMERLLESRSKEDAEVIVENNYFPFFIGTYEEAQEAIDTMREKMIEADAEKFINLSFYIREREVNDKIKKKIYEM